MMKFAPLAMLALVLVAAAPTPQVGPVTTKPEDDLRARARDFNQAMLKGRYDEAIKFVDPATIEAVGEDKVKEQLEGVMNAAKGLTALVGRKITGFQIRKTEVKKEKQPYTGLVTIGYSTATAGTHGERTEHTADQHWVFKNKLWYFLK